MRRRSLPFVLALALAGLCSTLACAPSGFEDVSQVDTVRIFAASADQPYAKPGATVTVNVLAFDARPTQPETMAIYWLPPPPLPPCENPPGDAYYGCFGQFAQAAATLLQEQQKCTPEDLTGCLPQGPRFTFTMPADTVTSHPVVPGVPVPYGEVILFNVACAGHLALLPSAGPGGNPAQPPIGCFHKDGSAAPPADYVIGYTRVYAYDTVTNANPVIDHVEVQGQPIDPSAGFGTPRCPSGGNCPGVRIGPVIPASSQEDNPEDVDPQGNVRKEEIWTDYYATFGSFDADARLVYDPTGGALPDPDGTWHAPDTPGDGTIWIVAHDNRGGASWAIVPVHVQ